MLFRLLRKSKDEGRLTTNASDSFYDDSMVTGLITDYSKGNDSVTSEFPLEMAKFGRIRSLRFWR